MSTVRSTRKVLAAVGCPHLSLYRGSGYWYFVYDDEEAGIFEERSVMTLRLSDLTLETWTYEGRALVEFVESAR